MKRSQYIIFPIFVALSLVFFWKAGTGKGAFFHYDTWMHYFASRAWWFGQLADGHFATWCPGLFAGYPLFAESQIGALYPPTFILFLAFPPTLAFSWSVILHFAFAGAGLFALARIFGLCKPACLLAAIVYAFSGFMITHLIHLNLLIGASWIPWALFFAVGSWQGRPRSLLGLACSLAALFLAPHPNTTLLAFLLLPFAMVFLVRRGAAAIGLCSMVLGGGIILGLCLAAVQILPTADFLDRTVRGEGVEYSFLTFGSFPPWGIARLANPDLAGTPVDGTYFAHLDWSVYAETTAYVGLLTIALAVAAIILSRGPVLLTFLTGGAVSFLLMLGSFTPVYRIFTWIPLFESTRVPGRFALPLSLCMAMLAGLGLHSLLSSSDRRRKALALAGGFAALLAICLFAHFLSEETGAFQLNDPTVKQMIGSKLDAIQATVTDSNNRMWILFSASLLAVYPLTFGYRILGAAAYLPALVIFVDLLYWGSGFNPTLAPEKILDPPPVVAALPETLPRPRIFRQGIHEFWERNERAPRTDLFTPAWKGNLESYSTGAWSMTPNSHLLYGVDSGEGFTPLMTKQWLEWVGLPPRPMGIPRPILTEGQIDLLSIDAVLSSAPARDKPGGIVEELPGALFLLRNENPLPRVRLSQTFDVMETREELLARLRHPDHDPRTITLLEDEPGWMSEQDQNVSTDASLHAREIGPGHWLVDLPAGEDGIVILAEAYDPDWKAETASGEPVDLIRADGLFLAFVTRGEGGTVELRHAPGSLRRGARISLAAIIVAFLLVLVVGRWKLPSLLRSPYISEAIGIPRAGSSILVLALLIVLSSWLGDVGEWKANFRESRIAPALSRSISEQGLSAYRANAFGPAVRILQVAVSLDPESAPAQYRLGLAQSSLGRRAAARQSLGKALEIDPAFEAARRALDEM